MLFLLILFFSDVKPDNILYDNQKSDLIKLCDFGNAQIFNESQKMHHKFGTIVYVAPEVLNGSYDEKCDIWSCGIILYILLCGYPPFTGKTDNEIIKQIENGDVTFSGYEWQLISNEAKELIKSMIFYESFKRPTAQQCLENIWFGKSLIPLECEKGIIENALKNIRKFNVKKIKIPLDKLNKFRFIFFF